MNKNIYKNYIFAILYIFSAKNNTFIHVTDITGRQTICRSSAGMKAKTDKDEKSNYCAILSTQDIVKQCKKFGITAFHVRIRARGGNGSNTISSAGHSVMRAIIRSGFKIGKIDDVTPLPTNGTRKKGGRRGRRI